MVLKGLKGILKKVFRKKKEAKEVLTITIFFEPDNQTQKLYINGWDIEHGFLSLSLIEPKEYRLIRIDRINEFVLKLEDKSE